MAKKPTYSFRYIVLVLLAFLCAGTPVEAAINLNATDIAARAKIFFAPQNGTFIEGSTFEVPVYINTGRSNVNTVELDIRFDPTKLTMVNPSGGKSIIELWIEPPTYNNTSGSVKITGVIPNGITTNSGLIATLTFKAKNTGQATVSIRDTSRVLLNDGIGSPINYDSNRATYTIVARPPEGVEVFSETHPFQDLWYNNKNPIVTWTRDPSISGFSTVIDNKPNTIPDNKITSIDNVQAFENLGDGLWYFHIKAQKKGIWGGTTHRLIRIDTTPPAEFKPTVNYLAAVVINRSLISFFTTDSLSGMDHYEVGVIDKAAAPDDSPAFFQTESPYQLPLDNIEKATVIVRAFDRAGNVRDVSIDVGNSPWQLIKNNAIWILAVVLLLALVHLSRHRKKPVLMASIVLAFSLLATNPAEAAPSLNLQASDVTARAEIFFSPPSGTFIEGSTFDIPVFINTKGNSVNTIELNVRFDPTKLSIVKPSGGKSVIELWIEPPSHNNVAGTVKVSGVIPNGLSTNSGLLTNITFQAKNTGQAVVSIQDTSRILLNDGIGSPINYETNRATYTIIPRPPDGVEVFSETHPFTERWYNNKNPVFNWTKDAGVTGFSIVIDDKPATIPENTITTTETIKAYENLTDGLSYFHIKAQKRGVWGGTTHRLIRIDSTPPAEFTPTVNYLAALVINRSLISFFTTDSLSGIDHYEVGVIDKSKPTTEIPTFYQTESPYQLPLDNIEEATVIVRAIDRAGNVRDASIDVAAPFAPLKWVKDHAVWILLVSIIFIILLLIIHYLFGHRILKHLRRAFQIAESEDAIPKFTETLPGARDESTYTPLSNEDLLNRPPRP